jgi:cell division transport system ATP-binding protein
MITFSDVSKIFFNGQHGLENVSFTVEPGELVFITGHTGSGKTTLMRLLTKEYNPTSGEIIFDNIPLSKIKPSKVHELRRRIGVVFQDYRLLPEFNVWENIALPLSIIGKKSAEIEQRVTDLLKLVHLEDKANLFPSELSGGEAQRISIARALATAPPVLFADEPTGNLDPETSKAIIKLLKKINEMGTTVLLATHDVVVFEALEGMRHLVLEGGKLIKDTAAKLSKGVEKIEENLEKEVQKVEASAEEILKEHETVENLDDDEPVPEKQPKKESHGKKKHS